MKKGNDVQRQRVYDAETASGYAWMGFFPTLEAAQWWTDRIVKSDWWQRRSKVKQVALSYNHRTIWCDASVSRVSDKIWKVVLGGAGMCHGIILHELAHVLEPEATHGPDFVRRELELYEHWAPNPAPMRLKEAFIRYKVDM